MKRAACLIAALGIFAAPLTALAQKSHHTPNADVKPTKASTIDITLVVGDNKTIPATDVSSYSVGTQGIVDVKVAPDMKQFVFVGLKPGATTVLMLKSSGTEVTYSITVYARPPDVVEKEVEQLLQGYTGLRLRSVGPRFFIEGGVSTEADARRVALIASLYPGQVESLVVVGSVGEEHTINIRIDFYFVQYDKSSSYGVGLAYPTSFGAGAFNGTYDLVNKAGTATFTGTAVLPSLDLAASHGWAKVLKHSVVVTTSGTEATFENGGERNFAVATGLTGTIQAIKFGTNVTVLPRFDKVSKALEVKVNANVSDLTTTGDSPLPGRTTSTVSTFVHLKLGQSLVLSGIKTSSQSHQVSGLPGLSQIPILGLLFASHTNQEADVEGAVFIVPSVIDSLPRRTHDIVGAAMSSYEKYSGEIENAKSFPHDAPDYQ